MKRVLFAVVAMMMSVVAWSQSDEMTRAQADKLDSVTIKLMNQEIEKMVVLELVCL